MANFRIEAPDGKTYRVEAPDAESAAAAIDEMMGQTGSRKGGFPELSKAYQDAIKPQETGVVEDVLKSAGSGIVTGLHGLAGIGGDVMHAAEWAGTGLGNLARGAMGMEPVDQAPDPLGLRNALPDTGDVMEATGWDKNRYVPKTKAGEFAGTVGEFIPGAATMGGGLIKAGAKGAAALAGQMGKNALVAVPAGLASEGAGQLTKGTALEPFARAAGAVVGTGVAGVGRALAGNKSKAISSDALKAEGRQMYKSLDDPANQVVLEPAAFNRIANNVSQAAYKARISNATPKSFALLKEVENMGAAGVAPDILEIEGLRQQLGALAKSPEASERFMAGLIKSKLDDAMDALKPADVIAGDPNAALDTLTRARSVWSKAKKGETIEGLLERAERRVAANYTTAGLMTAIRQEFKNLANRKDFKALFRPDERKAIEQIIRGTTTESVIRFVSKFDPRSPIISLMLGGAGMSMGPAGMLGAAAVGAAGAGAKALTNRASLRNVDRLREMVTTGVTPPPNPRATLPALGGYYGMRELSK